MAFDHSAVVAPFRMQPGLRRMVSGAPHLTPNRPGDRVLREKLAVLSSFADEALVAAADLEVDDIDAALRRVAAQAVAEHPDAFEHDGATRFDARTLGWSVDGTAVAGDGPAEIGACVRALAPAWRRAGLLALAFAEDLALLDGASGRVPWLAVCLPSNWAPDEKVGRHFAEIHAPVADNRALLAAARPLLDLVTGGAPWERFVWTFADDPRLHRHPRRTAPGGWEAASTPEAVAATTWLRSERQTFLPVPGARQAVFTIGVESTPLGEAIGSADDAARLHAALASMSVAVLAYRGLGGVRDRLLAWLATRAELPA